MPRKCTICSNKKLTEINKAVSAGGSYRSIAIKFAVGVQSLYRHIENCLGLTLGAIIEKRKEEGGIDVYEEFEKNLEFARKLRVAAEEYLSDPIDPLRIIITPFAHEITVSYFDHTDLTEQGKPTKKTAPLSNLLNAVQSIGEMVTAGMKARGTGADAEMIVAGTEGSPNVPPQVDAEAIFAKIIEIDRITIKHVDLRSFALDAVAKTDQCVDRFARLGGLYQKEAENKKDFENALAAVKGFLTTHPDADKDKVIGTFATGRGIPAERIKQELGMIG